MKQIWLVLILAVSAIAAVAQQQTPEEQAVWKLEHDYWKYVQAADLDAYRNLWNVNFIGWPQSSAAPARKDHITDWIKLHSDKGEVLQAYELKQAGSQFTENLVVTHYWLTDTWKSKDGATTTESSRITHTWLLGKDGWQIIGGMSAPVTKKPS
jgi:Domain of unknown function (DUF4440)